MSLGDAGGIGDLEEAVDVTQAISAFAPMHAAMNNLADALPSVGKVSVAVTRVPGAHGERRAVRQRY